ncbi:UDP-N-acetylmuramate dehydrogenase [Wenzhouxiangella limi]|uniref:UDP-N-acetylenolpyruvoylglucosamine reductase n=1 Tax=Wenzhouxiangella limi TaxID=2707351 RepID=A0A845UX90_9GAMM|nr:UDP-N-acetylmuramate dehydrogenase [Wenzhouxiangella limi]NDY94460.1 UDP-N-acetylmuramate dehydrogenase [Wenzhouxiangella limi]
MPQPERRFDADLAALSTFRLPARAAEVIFLDNLDQLAGLSYGHPLLVLGGGSNTIFLANWTGTVLVNRLRGISVERASQRDSRVRVAAGENWHRLVRWCLDHGLHGLENLALIPGSVGAAPIQNIGAYGVEIADVLESVTAWDWRQNRLRQLPAEACGFGYRASRFRDADRGRFLITSITLRLRHEFRPQIGYQSLAAELKRRHGDRIPGPRALTAAVMRLRRHRLPDPARLANAGSFFKNPVVSGDFASSLLSDHPHLPHWTMADGQVKLAAGWMIEQRGWKGKSVGAAAVYPNHALVLINRGGASAQQLGALVDAIRADIQRSFGVRLEPEPILIGRA